MERKKLKRKKRRKTKEAFEKEEKKSVKKEESFEFSVKAIFGDVATLKVVEPPSLDSNVPLSSREINGNAIYMPKIGKIAPKQISFKEKPSSELNVKKEEGQEINKIPKAKIGKVPLGKVSYEEDIGESLDFSKGIEQKEDIPPCKLRKVELEEVKSLTVSVGNDVMMEKVKVEPFEILWRIQDLSALSSFKLERPILVMYFFEDDPSEEREIPLGIEVFKRILREICHVFEDLPLPIHIGTQEEWEDLKSSLKIGKKIVIVDLRNVPFEENKETLSDRILEMYSQSFGFLVLCLPKEDEEDWEKELEFKNLYADLVRVECEKPFLNMGKYIMLIFGFYQEEEPLSTNIDELAIKFDAEFYKKLREKSLEPDILIKVNRSPERESLVHFGLKALIYEMLVRRYGEDNIETEKKIGGIIADIARCEGGRIKEIYEIETLWGCGDPVAKILSKAEDVLGASPKELKTLHIVIQPLHAAIFYRWMRRAELELKRKWGNQKLIMIDVPIFVRKGNQTCLELWNLQKFGEKLYEILSNSLKFLG